MKHHRLFTALLLCLALSLSCNDSLVGLDDGGGDGSGGDGGGKCVGLQCQIANCAMGTRTTLSGVVNIPLGTLPLYNATVYIPNDKVVLPTSGPGCDRCDSALPGNPVTKTTTDINGQFTLTNVPSGKAIPLVIKVGKWIRQTTIDNVPSCTETKLDPVMTRLPSTKAEGNIPRIALSTGSADAMECLLRKLGIADKEFTTEGGDGRVNLYAGNGANNPTNKFDAALGGAAFTGSKMVPAASWWDSYDNFKQYDIVVLSCEGTQNLTYKSTAARASLQNYIDNGGRVFASHWHNAWIEHAPMPLSRVATWGGDNMDATIQATIDAPANMPSDHRNAFADWMVLPSVGGSKMRGSFEIQHAKHTIMSIDPTLTQRWVYYQPNMRTQIQQYFQFNAPVGSAGNMQCGRMVFSDIHVTGAAGGDTSNPNKPFPTGCVTKDLTPQEKALIFMLFDLSNCLDPIIG